MCIYKTVRLSILLSIIIFLSIDKAFAQGFDFSTKVLPSTVSPSNLQTDTNFPVMLSSSTQILATETRTSGDYSKISASSSLTNSPPVIDISPLTQTIKVGEKIRVRFSFSDPENDPYFAGVIAVTPRVVLEDKKESRKQMQRAASVKIDVLPSENPAVVVWDITAQNQGVAVFFVSISEVFTVRNGNNIQFVAGQVKRSVYSMRVVDSSTEEPEQAPKFVGQIGDMELRLKERVRLNFASTSQQNRPVTYGFLFLSFASRLANTLVGPNSLQLKAVEPGKGIFVAYVTDGRRADVQSFQVIVSDGMTATPELLLRTLSKNSVVGVDKPTSLVLYGENFTPASLVFLSSQKGQMQLSTSFINSNQLQVEIPKEALAEDGETGAEIKVEDSKRVSNSLDFRLLAPVLTTIKRLRNEAGLVEEIRFIGLGLGLNPLITANGVKLKVLTDRSIKTKFGDRVVVTLPKMLRDEQSIELVVKNSAGFEAKPVLLPLN
ncbi:MAG: hypothetical protein JNN15_05375 [Blastocatellia bacterium]|nr:hypothetical protein [Blastocatellia bacterium]